MYARTLIVLTTPLHGADFYIRGPWAFESLYHYVVWPKLPNKVILIWHLPPDHQLQTPAFLESMSNWVILSVAIAVLACIDSTNIAITVVDQAWYPLNVVSILDSLDCLRTCTMVLDPISKVVYELLCGNWSRLQRRSICRSCSFTARLARHSIILTNLVFYW